MYAITGKVSVIFTEDGKSFLTPEQLEHEIYQEVTLITLITLVTLIILEKKKKRI